MNFIRRMIERIIFSIFMISIGAFFFNAFLKLNGNILSEFPFLTISGFFIWYFGQLLILSIYYLIMGERYFLRKNNLKKSRLKWVKVKELEKSNIKRIFMSLITLPASIFFFKVAVYDIEGIYSKWFIGTLTGAYVWYSSWGIIINIYSLIKLKRKYRKKIKRVKIRNRSIVKGKHNYIA